MEETASICSPCRGVEKSMSGLGSSGGTLEGTCETRRPLRSGARAGAGRHAIHGQAAAIIVAADPLTLENQRFIIDQCLTLKLPAIHTYISEARSGALLTYGVDTAKRGACGLRRSRRLAETSRTH